MDCLIRGGLTTAKIAFDSGVEQGPSFTKLRMPVDTMISNSGFQTSLAESGGRLPPHHSELIGRENEIEAILSLMREQGARLITLTGPGGVGKTRLGVAVADRAVGLFPGGIWFVSLAALETPSLVLPEIASTLGVRDASGEELLIRISERIGALPVLVILDNLEHVITVSPEIARMLQMAPKLTVLSTTREPLMVRGEIAFPVHPLATESGEPAGLSAAERLFITRASESSYGFEATGESRKLIREICRRLGGIPLAIELAATWVKVLPAQRLLDNIDRQLDVLVRGICRRVSKRCAQQLPGAISSSPQNNSPCSGR
ncbi:hypothetical protein BH23CHL4_BH23CHL4_02130 [soil metagenome]